MTSDMRGTMLLNRRIAMADPFSFVHSDNSERFWTKDTRMQHESRRSFKS
jgi:hypothetical protein